MGFLLPTLRQGGGDDQRDAEAEQPVQAHQRRCALPAAAERPAQRRGSVHRARQCYPVSAGRGLLSQAEYDLCFRWALAFFSVDGNFTYYHT